MYAFGETNPLRNSTSRTLSYSIGTPLISSGTRTPTTTTRTAPTLVATGRATTMIVSSPTSNNSGSGATELNARQQQMVDEAVSLIMAGMPVDQALFTSGSDEGIAELRRQAAAGSILSAKVVQAIDAALAARNGGGAAIAAAGSAAKKVLVVGGALAVGGVLWLALRRRK